MSITIKRHRLRFSLRTMLMVAAIIAAILGYAQWRRQSIMRESRALQAQGFTLLWQDTWADWIWPVVPKQAAFSNKVKIGSDFASVEEYMTFYYKACDRLRALGVEEVRLDHDGKAGDSYTSTKHGEWPVNTQAETQ